MGMQSSGGVRRVVAEINVTPMVDVMLVLLVIFMIVAPMLRRNVPVDLPRSTNSELDANILKESSAVISIPEDGTYYVGRERVANIEDIPRSVGRLLKDKRAEDHVIYVKAGTLVQYREVVGVVDCLRNAEPQHWDRVGLVTEKDSLPVAAHRGP